VNFAVDSVSISSKPSKIDNEINKPNVPNVIEKKAA
jgi:hypothetical protein